MRRRQRNDHNNANNAFHNLERAAHQRHYWAGGGRRLPRGRHRVYFRYALRPGKHNSMPDEGQTYTDAAFLDSGSNAIYFLDSRTTGIPTCTDLSFWYCAASTTNFSATNEGANGATGTFNFSIGNADTLTSKLTNGVAADLGGPGFGPGTFDWGLPFFFGRNVYTAIEGRSTPGGQGPYWAY